MNVLIALERRSIRLGFFILVAGAGAVATLMAFVQSGPISGSAVAVLAITALVLFKGILELANDLEAEHRSQEQRYAVLHRQVESLIQDVMTRESALSRQASSIVLLLERVRAVEHSVGQLALGDEKVLERVRAVEHSVGQLALGDEKVYERVRAVEHSVGEQRRVDRELLEEMQAVWSEMREQGSSSRSGSRRRNHEIGYHRELYLSQMMERLAVYLAEEDQSGESDASV